jgi:hypothetical protein
VLAWRFGPTIVVVLFGVLRFVLAMVGAVEGEDGKAIPIEQHHSLQKGDGPIFEIKQTTHKNPVNKKALHPYGKKLKMGLAFGCFNEKMESYFYDKRIASPFSCLYPILFY